MIHFKVYSGIDTVGGVIFELKDDKVRLLFEIGSAYDPKTDIYDVSVLHSIHNEIYTHLKIHKLPWIPGIYEKKNIRDLDLASSEDYDLKTYVFVSHLHLDHMCNLGVIDPNICVYMDENAQTVLKLLEETNQGVHYSFKNCKSFFPDTSIQLSSFKITPLLSKNEGYRDYAFYIETPEGNIHYTGDLMMHHLENEYTYKELEYVASHKTDILIVDTCSMLDSVLSLQSKNLDMNEICASLDIPSPLIDEKTMRLEMNKILENIQGLGVFNYYERELPLAYYFINQAKNLSKTAVFEPETAYILHKFYHLDIPYILNDQTIYTDHWFNELQASCTQITLEMLHKHPEKYLVQNTYKHSLELINYPKGTYIHAEGTPIGSFDPAYFNLKKILQLSHYDYVTFFNTSWFNHAYPSELKYYIEKVDPPILIPSHSPHPEKVMAKNGKQFIPEYNKEYIFMNGKLK